MPSKRWMIWDPEEQRRCTVITFTHRETAENVIQQWIDRQRERGLPDIPTETLERLEVRPVP